MSSGSSKSAPTHRVFDLLEKFVVRLWNTEAISRSLSLPGHAASLWRGGENKTMSALSGQASADPAHRWSRKS
jgi:hypothetical protein